MNPFRHIWFLRIVSALFALALTACSLSDDDDDQVLPANDDDVPANDDDVTANDDDATDIPLSYADRFTLVEVDSGTPLPLQLAVNACAGLKNRVVGGSIYIQKEAHDKEWLEELDLSPDEVVSAADFLTACVAEFPTCVRYSYEEQQRLLPNILTVAAALEALPLDVALAVACDDVAFDATIELKENNTPYLATKYVFENYIEKTTGLAMLNPGYEIWSPSDLTNPELNRDMSSALVDFVFTRKLFVLFLVNGCIDGNPEEELLHKIVNAGQWPTPVGVYGYNNSWFIGGFIYEAQTRCLESRNMGAIPTETGNLSFFSTRRPPITEENPLQPNELENIEYDPNKTYVAFMVGDGDNVRFIMTTRNVWLRQRLADCEKPDNSCAPISWSISPHLTDLAPDVLEWYYALSRQTGKDYFILPPSGHLYAYPAALNEEDGNRFIAATEQDARILGLHSTVHWEMSDGWHDAEDHFLPKYANAEGVIQGVFPVNVPYMFAAFPWWPADRFYNVLEGEDGSEVVVFRPRQWRGIRNDEDPFFLSPPKMAEEIAAYPPGTVTGIYMTSDGGLNLENSFMELVKILPPHVQLVSADTAARLALIAGGD